MQVECRGKAGDGNWGSEWERGTSASRLTSHLSSFYSVSTPSHSLIGSTPTYAPAPERLQAYQTARSRTDKFETPGTAVQGYHCPKSGSPLAIATITLALRRPVHCPSLLGVIPCSCFLLRGLMPPFRRRVASPARDSDSFKHHGGGHPMLNVRLIQSQALP